MLLSSPFTHLTPIGLSHPAGDATTLTPIVTCTQHHLERIHFFPLMLAHHPDLNDHTIFLVSSVMLVTMVMTMPPPSPLSHCAQEDIAALHSLVAAANGDNHTVWFSHYPSSIITTDHQQLHKLLGTSTAHVCGHLHTLGGLVTRMYGKHRDGHLELELGDFRFTQAYVPTFHITRGHMTLIHLCSGIDC